MKYPLLWLGGVISTVGSFSGIMNDHHIVTMLCMVASVLFFYGALFKKPSLLTRLEDLGWQERFLVVSVTEPNKDGSRLVMLDRTWGSTANNFHEPELILVKVRLGMVKDESLMAIGQELKIYWQNHQFQFISYREKTPIPTP